jgi:hypothetical protein
MPPGSELMLAELRNLALEVGFIRSNTRPRETLSTAARGKILRRGLVDGGLWTHLKEVPGGDAVVTEAEYQVMLERLKKARGDKLSVGHLESLLVQLMTPFLRRAITLGWVLLNTERHPYIPAYSGRDLKPDMVLAHAVACMLKVTDGDRQYMDEYAQFFGPAVFDFRDFFACIFEFKWDIGAEESEPLGKVAWYAELLAFHDTKHNPHVHAETLGGIKVVLADHKQFQMITCNAFGDPMSSVMCRWTQPGSKAALSCFLAPGKSPWIHALNSLCEMLGVHPPTEPTARPVLGHGASSRVFRVTKDDKNLVLKVALSESLESIEAENKQYDTFEAELEVLSAAQVTIPRVSFAMSGANRFGGLLVEGVIGVGLPKKKYAIKSALEGLIRISSEGLTHGDARVGNVIWVDGELSNGAGQGGHARWIDYRTLHKREGTAQASWMIDVTKFAASIEDVWGVTSVVAALQQFNSDDTSERKLECLMTAFAPVWSSMASEDAEAL